LSIKAKQVAGVTALVVLVVAGMIAVQIASLTRLRIDETASRAKSLKEAMLHRAAGVVREAGMTDPYVAIRNDSGMRSILESAVTTQPDTNTILYAAIVDTRYRAALALAEQLGMRPLIAHCHLGLGTLYRRSAKPEPAREHLATAASMYRDMGMTYWLDACSG